MSFEEELLMNAPVDGKNTINGKSGAIDPIPNSAAPVVTQDCSQPMVLDSIMRNGSSGEKETKEGNELKKSPDFKCSKCPRKFKTNMMRVMHEKLHKMQYQRIEKNKKPKKKVENTPAPAAKASLLFKDSNACFGTPVAKSKHLNTSGKKPAEELLCRKCSKPYLSSNILELCYDCWKEDTYAKIAQSRSPPSIPESNSSTDKADKCAILKSKKPVKSYEKRPRKPEVSKLRKEDELPSLIDNTPKESLPAKVRTEEPSLENSPAIETTSELRFSCSFCPRKFVFPNMLSQHSRQEHQQFHFCDFCLLNLKSDQQLEVHKLECERTKLTKQQRQCKQTLFDFSSLSCRLCNLEFETELKLVDHALANHGNLRGGECCGKYYASEELVMHKKLIHGAVSEVQSAIEMELSEKCEVLNAAVKKLQYGEIPCSFCSYSAYTWSALSDHRKKIHKV
ncbi:zinc finger protein 423-like [Cloeon dipterum]|uniref:zinc finger protein 423-like n=1 Tax=Cloeon dipterum TaxID=197152 RepID=UPI00322094B1